MSRCRHSVQVRLDSCQPGAHARAINLQVFHNALNVIARLRQGDALHPINRINLGITRVAVLGHPLLDAAVSK